MSSPADDAIAAVNALIRHVDDAHAARTKLAAIARDQWSGPYHTQFENDQRSTAGEASASLNELGGLVTDIRNAPNLPPGVTHAN